MYPGTAEVVVPSPRLDEGMQFFLGQGFRVDQIFPADDPATVRMSGHGLALRLERNDSGAPPTLLIGSPTVDAQEATGPNGTVLRWYRDTDELEVPPGEQSFTVSRMSDDDAWNVGRAGMHYRDLIPDRQGGRFIASHIRIVDGGPVPDYVHHHHIRFQMIWCFKGWVDVVYEDQGPPFRLLAGDCVLQPPHIRHRVLESSAGCEVIEIGCPAIHETIADHDMALPTPTFDPERIFGGQRFVRHHQADAAPEPGAGSDVAVRDTGIGAATRGLASVRALRCRDGQSGRLTSTGEHEFLFQFLLAGSAQLTARDETINLGPGDCLVVPSGMKWDLFTESPDFELLEVALPAR